MNWVCGMGDALVGTRDRVKEKVGIARPICGFCPGGCNASCCDSFWAALCCPGPALAQERRELRIFYGHTTWDAPKHPGTPAAAAGVAGGA